MVMPPEFRLVPHLGEHCRVGSICVTRVLAAQYEARVRREQPGAAERARREHPRGGLRGRRRHSIPGQRAAQGDGRLHGQDDQLLSRIRVRGGRLVSRCWLRLASRTQGVDGGRWGVQQFQESGRGYLLQEQQVARASPGTLARITVHLLLPRTVCVATMEGPVCREFDCTRWQLRWDSRCSCSVHPGHQLRNPNLKSFLVTPIGQLFWVTRMDGPWAISRALEWENGDSVETAELHGCRSQGAL